MLISFALELFSNLVQDVTFTVPDSMVSDPLNILKSLEALIVAPATVIWPSYELLPRKK